MISSTRQIVRTACVAMTLSMTTAAVFSMSAQPAFAERGGNGNGNSGNGNSGNNGNGNSGNNGNANSGNNGRGHLARELGSLNAAHANPNALANASPDSMPGKLNVFKLAQENLVEVIAVQDETYAEYERLTGLTVDEIEAEFPNGGYEDAVTVAADEYNVAREDAVQAQIAAEESLSVVTGGRELSNDAMVELWGLLGL